MSRKKKRFISNAHGFNMVGGGLVSKKKKRFINNAHEFNLDFGRPRESLLLLVLLLLVPSKRGCAHGSLLEHFSRKGDPEAGVAALRADSVEAAALDARDDAGRTPLMLASRWSSLSTGLRARVDAASLLLDHGADHDLRDNEKGWSALHYAIYASKWAGTDMVDLLLAHPSLDADLASNRGKRGQTPLMIAAARGERKVVNRLLERGGININAVDEDKHSATIG